LRAILLILDSITPQRPNRIGKYSHSSHFCK